MELSPLAPQPLLSPTDSMCDAINEMDDTRGPDAREEPGESTHGGTRTFDGAPTPTDLSRPPLDADAIAIEEEAEKSAIAPIRTRTLTGSMIHWSTQRRDGLRAWLVCASAFLVYAVGLHFSF